MRQELFWFCEDEVRLYLWHTCHQPSRVKLKVAQLYLTLCDPMDCTVRGILQTRILEWVAIPFSRGSSQPRDRTQVSHVAGGFFTVWATREAHPSRGSMPISWLLWPLPSLGKSVFSEGSSFQWCFSSLTPFMWISYTYMCIHSFLDYIHI